MATGQRWRSPRQGAPHVPLFIVLVTCFAMGALLLGACNDDGSDSGEPTAVLDSQVPTENLIAVTGSGFEPESLEVPRDAYVTIRNSRDETISVILTGTSGDGEPREIDAGGFLQFRLNELGAHVLTLEDDAETTATVMVVQGEPTR